jgi:hypothetical protein
LYFALGVLFSYGIAAAISHGNVSADPVEFRFRTTGGLLQLFGVLLVAWEIRKTRRAFGIPPVAREFANEIVESAAKLWRLILRILRVRRDVIFKTTGARFEATGGIGEGRVQLRPGAHMSLEQRVQLLEMNVSSIEDIVDKLKADLSEESHARVAAMSAEQRDRQQGIADLRLQIRELTVGGIRLQIVGLWWLLLGLLVATWPQELARLLPRLPFVCD